MVATIVTATLEGVVSKTNGNGFKVEGREGWLNFSKFASPVPAMPSEGAHVLVGLDKGGYVREVETLGSTAAVFCIGETPTGAPIDKDRRITRMACLNTATAILTTQGAVDAADVLTLAACLETWVLR
jgi:hypothetical protein